jgi:hypothetical protein
MRDVKRVCESKGGEGGVGGGGGGERKNLLVHIGLPLSRLLKLKIPRLFYFRPHTSCLLILNCSKLLLKQVKNSLDLYRSICTQ